MYVFRFLIAHQQVLSIPSDMLVMLMTLTRLKIILKVGEKMSGVGMNNQPRPILHEVIGVYILSFILDGPNWMIFDVQVLDSCFLNESFIFILKKHSVMWSYEWLLCQHWKLLELHWEDWVHWSICIYLVHPHPPPMCLCQDHSCYCNCYNEYHDYHQGDSIVFVKFGVQTINICLYLAQKNLETEEKIQWKDEI